MAYLLEDEDEKKNLDQQNALNASQNQLGSAQGNLIQAQSAPQGAGDTSGSIGGTNYATLQKYITQNQSLAPSLAEGVGNQIRTASGEAKTAAQSAADKYKQDVAQVKPEFTAQSLQFQGLSPSYFDRGSIGASIEQQTPQIVQAQSQKYQSPYDFNTALQPAREKQASAENLSELSKSEGGRYDLLKKAFKTPTYSQGQARLDQALIQLDPEASNTLSRARDDASTFQGYLDSVKQDVSEVEAQKPTEYEQATGGIKQSAQAKLQEYLKMLEDSAAKINKAPKYEILPEHYAALGGRDSDKINPFETFYDAVNPSDFYKQAGGFSAASIADQKSRADLAALANLAGVANPLSGDYIDPSLAKGSFDRSGYEKALIDKIGSVGKSSRDDFANVANKAFGNGNGQHADVTGALEQNGYKPDAYGYLQYIQDVDNTRAGGRNVPPMFKNDIIIKSALDGIKQETQQRQKLGLPTYVDVDEIPSLAKFNSMSLPDRQRFVNALSRQSSLKGSGFEDPNTILSLFNDSTDAPAFMGASSYEDVLKYYDSAIPSGRGPRSPSPYNPGIYQPDPRPRTVDPGVGVISADELPDNLFSKLRPIDPGFGTKRINPWGGY
jgi:hypothetical protein